MRIEGIEASTLLGQLNSVSKMCCFHPMDNVFALIELLDFTANCLKENNEDEEWLDLLLVNYFCSY